jgi:hypothetical protein
MTSLANPASASLAQQELQQAYGTVKQELVRVLQLQQLDPRSGAAIAQRLGVNRQLAWQVATIASEPSAAAGLTVMPGARGLEMFVEASQRGASQRGVDPESLGLRQLRAAIERLEAVITTHAGDRATLALLAATWDSAEVERRTEDLRRDAYRAQCALLGARVETQVRGVIFAPSQVGDPTRLAMASYQGLAGVTRIRAAHRSRLFYLELPKHDDGTMDTRVPDLGVHLREKFQLEASLSSVGPDALDYIVDGHRSWVTLKPGQIGSAARERLAFTGLPGYENPRYISGRDHLNQVAIVCHIPTETLLVDCLMDQRLPESREFVSSLLMQCYDASTGHPMSPAMATDPAFLFELTDVEPLGMATFQADPHFAGTGDLVSRAAQRVGTTPANLVGIRCRLRYATAPMSVVITRRLPAAPARV